eukprot:TRINITY_DN26236_c0_g1_i1.p1 TRINITY_DN26236_c0_g1~~TRINITY_DN26236_c0_g1_i1.p1  ORF type:complete len:133 (+),score=26.69 TRINITY_DN26236_c0_g1_i1:79-477(+)
MRAAVVYVLLFSMFASTLAHSGSQPMGFLQREADTLLSKAGETEQLALKMAKEGGAINFVLAILPFLILLLSSYWVYKTHNEMKETGVEPTLGWKSVCCCVLCCCGVGTFMGLCYPIDEGEAKKAAEAIADQ